MYPKNSLSQGCGLNCVTNQRRNRVVGGGPASLLAGRVRLCLRAEGVLGFVMHDQFVVHEVKAVGARLEWVGDDLLH